MGYEIDLIPVGEGEKSGDAIALRFGNLLGERNQQRVVIIDGGFKESGERLVQHVRRYYKTELIDAVISTHPDSDHANGLEVVLEELKVSLLFMHQPWNHTEDIDKMFSDGRVTDNSVREALRRSLDTARELERVAAKKGIYIIEPFSGQNIALLNGNNLRVIGPSRAYYECLLPHFRGTPEPSTNSALNNIWLRGVEAVQNIAESWDYETLNDEGETSAENNSSVVSLLSVDGHSLLFTADAGIPALEQSVVYLASQQFDFSKLFFIQVPHHGSARNIGPSVLNQIIGPILPGDQKTVRCSSYVSVAKESDSKHPSKKVTNAFLRRGAPVYGTKGNALRYGFDAPDREGWTKAEPIPFFSEVED